ncbi:hypothetical protein [Chryseobacterium sp. HSC-36S06]|uniref:hypothetical protein n=1 Tax=Chryseobacterium sp. HSC-36S06 TaxID=2910970 RepID=UPI00209CF3F1|nr:hypothetical protein [Chryseobacterium sp. HSC-36S06]MCP2038431.1 hypothetical protein [Chryseobacterium sp. HSC-36S06]
MRLNNRNKAGFYNFISTTILLIFVFGCGAFFMELFKFDFLGKGTTALLIIVPSFLGLIFYLRGRQIFEYDSDGEALNFKNRNVLFYQKAISDEFPKYKLVSYEIIDVLILQKLYINVSSKKNKVITLKYDISYLSKKELKDLKFSLSKVIKENQEIKREN